MQQELVVLKQTTLCKSLVLQDFPKVEWMSSIDGIRTYKQVSNEQKEDISHVLNSATNGDILPQPKNSNLSKVTCKIHATPIQSNTCSKWTSCHHQLDKLFLHYNKLRKVTPARIHTLFTLYGRLQKKTLRVAREASRQVRKASVANFRLKLRT